MSSAKLEAEASTSSVRSLPARRSRGAASASRRSPLISVAREVPRARACARHWGPRTGTRRALGAPRGVVGGGLGEARPDRLPAQPSPTRAREFFGLAGAPRTKEGGFPAETGLFAAAGGNLRKRDCFTREPARTGPPPALKGACVSPRAVLLSRQGITMGAYKVSAPGRRAAVWPRRMSAQCFVAPHLRVHST